MKAEYLFIAGGNGGEVTATHLIRQKDVKNFVSESYARGWRFFRLLRLNRNTGWYEENDRLKAVIHKALQETVTAQQPLQG